MEHFHLLASFGKSSANTSPTSSRLCKGYSFRSMPIVMVSPMHPIHGQLGHRCRFVSSLFEEETPLVDGRGADSFPSTHRCHGCLNPTCSMLFNSMERSVCEFG